MAKRAFSSTSSSDATGATAPVFGLPAAAGADVAAGAAAADAAGGASVDEPFMKYQPAPAATTTAAAIPAMTPIDMPDFSSPPELLEELVTAESASAVEEMRAASFTARS